MLLSISAGAAAGDALTYHVAVAEHSCTDAANFAAMLRARATGAVAADADTADVRLDVTVHQSPDGDGAEGILTVHRDTTVSTRRVSAASCAEAADALALIAAMIMDTEAREREAREMAPAKPEQIPSEPPRQPRLPVPPPQWSLATNVSALLTGSVGRDTGTGMQFSVNAVRDVADSVVDWDFGAYFAVTFPAAAKSPGRGAKYSWWATGLAGCPVSWPPGPIRLRGCASFEGGLLTRTETFPNSQTDRTEWLAVTVGFRWQWAMVPWLELELAGSGVFPLLTGEFTIHPLKRDSYVDYETTSFTARGTAGLTFVLPL